MTEPNSTLPRPAILLLIEDNPSDVELTRQGLIEGRIPHKLIVARDGRQALYYLRRRRAEGQRLPDLIMLDLDLPGYNGAELLGYLRTHRQLHTIPIVIFTSSDVDRDLLTAYQLPADSYIRKPVDFDSFLETVIALGNRWLAPRRS